MRFILLLLKVSRPRFWLYLLGPFLIGLAVNPEVFSTSTTIWSFVLFFYFLIPANLYLYGVNDIADQDTDRFNPKKGDQEVYLQKETIKLLIYLLVGCLLLSLGIILLIPIWQVNVLMIAFVGLATSYSLPPLRLKARPVVDSLSNVLYIFPGLISYYLINQTLPSTLALVVLTCWTFAMHLFSAIPDIAADKRAHLQTTAVWLGESKSLIVCFILWLFFATTPIVLNILFPFNILLLIYPIMVGYSWFKRKTIPRVYWLFPWVNGGLGFLLFWYLVLQIRL